MLDVYKRQSLHHQTDIQRIEKRLKALFVTKRFKHMKK